MYEIPYTGNLSWLVDNTILYVRHGSHAYGLNGPGSDEDFKGVAIPPMRYFLGFSKRFDQTEIKTDMIDATIYGIKKFFKLASECNPNIIETLWVEPEDQMLVTQVGERLIDIREEFLSKRALHTFTGYAMSQLKRIKLHRRWLLEPPTHQPTRCEFGLPDKPVMHQNQMDAALSMISKKVDNWEMNLQDFNPPQRQFIMDLFGKILSEMSVNQNEKWRRAADLMGFESNFLQVLEKEKQYRYARNEWRSFQNWKKNRNPARAAKEAKFGYDCYTDDTEFLTDNGWKHYDDITEGDQLATVYLGDATQRKYLGIEYQSFVDRYEANYSGPLYSFRAYHFDVTVTPNHRMLYRYVSRKNNKADTNVQFGQAATVPDSFEFIRRVSPRTHAFRQKDVFEGITLPSAAYLTLMGWYLSDGCMMFNAAGKPKAIRISQKVGAKLAWKMGRFASDHKNKISISIATYLQKPTAWRPYEIDERVMIAYGKEFALRMFNDCGALKDKHIPRWAFGLTKRLLEKLLYALIDGDGTDRKNGSFVYYASLKQLADDVQEAALFAGWETSLNGPYGPYESNPEAPPMYQVHLRPNVSQFKRLVRGTNVTKRAVTDQRIVCFTVPNETLIVRKNGYIGVHGNSKHALHLVRLLCSAEEVLTTGKVIVKRPNRDELLSVLNGEWKYEELIEWAATKEAAAVAAAKVSKLPHGADQYALDAYCQWLVSSHERQRNA